MRASALLVVLTLAVLSGCASGPVLAPEPVALVAAVDPVPPKDPADPVPPKDPVDPVPPKDPVDAPPVDMPTGTAPTEGAPATTAPVVTDPRKRPQSYRFFRLEATLAGGRYEHDTDGGTFPIKDDAEAGMVRFLFEGTGSRGIGAGGSVELTGSDSGLDDPLGRPYRAGVLDVFGYFLYRGAGVGDERFIIPIRGGIYYQAIHLDDRTRSTDLTWSSLGLRVGAAPEVRFFRTGAVDWQGYADVMVGVQGTRAELDGASDDLTTAGTSLGGEIGARMVIARHFTIALSYQFRGTWLGKTESDKGVRLGDTSAIYYGPAFTIGLRF